MKIITVALRTVVLSSMLLAAGCGESKPVGKYVVWVGGDIVAVGYHTNEYKQNKGMVEFTDIRKGKKKIVPMTSVLDIDVNR